MIGSNAELHPTTLPPSSFAVVMATGVLSVAARGAGLGVVSDGLFGLAVAAFAALVALSTMRAARHRDAMRQDLTDATRVFGFFTFCASTTVLGVRFSLDGHRTVGLVLGCLAGAGTVAVAWLAIPVMLRAASRRGDLEAVAGDWLLLSVSIEALALLGITVAGARGQVLPVVALGLWCAGVFAYAAGLGLITTRVLTSRPGSVVFRPDHWIVMGVLALVSLVGTRLSLAAPRFGVLRPIGSAFEASAVALWVLASMWIPILLTLHVRGLVRDAASLRYRAGWWSAVFPPAVYAVATRELGAAEGWHAMVQVSLVALWVTLALWSTVAVGLVRAVLRPGPSRPPAEPSADGR